MGEDSTVRDALGYYMGSERVYWNGLGVSVSDCAYGSEVGADSVSARGSLLWIVSGLSGATSMVHGAWWRENHCGYTDNRMDAGIYSYEEACKIVHGANKHQRRDDLSVPNEAMIRVDVYYPKT